MAASNFTYAGNNPYHGTSSQHQSIQESTKVRQNDYGTGTYDSPATVGAWVNPNSTGPDDLYYPTMSDGFAGTGSAARELRNAPHPAPNNGHAQYHILNMSEFKDLEDTAISMRCSVRNNADKGGQIILFAYADQSEVLAFNALPTQGGGNHGAMYNAPIPGIYSRLSSADNSMSVQGGYRNLNKFDTYQPIHQMPNFTEYFGYLKIGDWTTMRFDIIPWADSGGVKHVRFRVFQALRNYHPLSEEAWQDYTRVSATDPAPSSIQDPANKISLVEYDHAYDEVFNNPTTDPTKLAGNPINGTGSVCGFGYHDAWNYPGGSLTGYGRAGITNFEVKILDQGT
jgi:hypothetical protein